jgi:hypothetical protein
MVRFDFTSSPLSGTGTYRISQCSFHLHPTTDLQFTTPTIWALKLEAEGGPFDEFISLSQVTQYPIALVTAPPMDSSTPPGPGPEPKNYNFGGEVTSAVAMYVSWVDVLLKSIPSTAPTEETFSITLDLHATIKLRAGECKLIARHICYSKDTHQELSKSVDTPVLYTISAQDVSEGKFTIHGVVSPACSAATPPAGLTKEASLSIGFLTEEILHKPSISPIFTDAAAQPYVSAAPVSAHYNPVLVKTDTSIKMTNAPASKTSPVPAQARPYYASFTPLVLNDLVVDLTGKDLVLTSSAASHYAPSRPLFVYFRRDAGDQVCNFGELGTQVPVLNGAGTSLTFKISELAKLPKTGEALTISCPNWFLHLTDLSRITTLTYTLATVVPAQALTVAAETDNGAGHRLGAALAVETNHFATHLHLAANVAPMAAWKQPAIFVGPPDGGDSDGDGGGDGGDGGDGDSKPKSHTALIVLVTLLVLAIIAGGIFYLYRSGKLTSCCCRKAKSAKYGTLLDEDDPQSQSYINMQNLQL